ncbi:methyl-accepting chemotaxis protein [Paenibacillus segetis]|uniref:Methyl-accepting chemotaxis protein n=1 Tax=Paenibacillus segetis TaxID=1325360 RepID=A0ABQ1YFG5_9BACL|nr:methyl-accepting chemotaxis protein [Paenibacillus segetis]GGH23117.1 hypothetical protein GCM10008013_21980 [Paenibacillus segetis]
MSSVRSKLVGSFTIVLVFVLVLAFIGLTQLGKMRDFTDEVTDRWMHGIELIDQVNLSIEQYESTYYQKFSTKDPKQLELLDTKINSLFVQIDDSISKYGDIVVSEVDKNTFAELTEAWGTYKTGMEKLNSGKASPEEVATITADLGIAFEQMRTSIDVLTKSTKDGIEQVGTDSNDVFTSTASVIFYLGIAILIVIAALAWLLIRNITKPLIATTAMMNQLADGDLSVQPMIVNRKDEFGKMMNAVNRTLSNLQFSIKHIQDSSNSIASSSIQMFASSEQNSEAAKQVTESIQQLSFGSEDQANTAMECGRVIDEMAQGVGRIAESTSEFSELSQHAANQANIGSEQIVDISNRMKKLSDSVTAASQTIHKLEQQSEKISEMSKFIGEIAVQTNLLALNANIEAARAGEHGRGFAVVAGEVRKLASQSDELSHGITEMIQSIQQDTMFAVSSMNQSLVDVHEGVVSVEQAELAFKEIVVLTNEVSTRVQETAAATEQLAASSEEVAASITNMGHIAKQSAGITQQVAASTEEQLASSEEITSASHALSGISKELKDLVNKFTL